MESLRLVALFFRGKEMAEKIPRKVDTKLELWKIPSGTSPEEAGLVSVLGSFFLLPNYITKIKKKNTENDDLYKGISVETGAFLCF